MSPIEATERTAILVVPLIQEHKEAVRHHLNLGSTIPIDGSKFLETGTLEYSLFDKARADLIQIISLWSKQRPQLNEAPRPYGRGIFSPLLRRERNPSEAPNEAKHSGAKGDKASPTYYIPEGFSARSLYWEKTDKHKYTISFLVSDNLRAEAEGILLDAAYLITNMFCLSPDFAQKVAHIHLP